MIQTGIKEGERIRCMICPHHCLMAEGKSGICSARTNSSGNNKLTTYGLLSSAATDPVEKKPLYHFYPGGKILSVGSWGCNMSCNFCQNHRISQEAPPLKSGKVTAEELVSLALREQGNIGIAYTYNEPVIWYEFVRSTALSAAAAGLKNVMVSNGYATEELMREYVTFIDAFNIDLKGFTEDFYYRNTGAHLGPVMNNLKIIAGSGRHLEITTLIVTGLNDNIEDFEREAEWIAGELGPEVPLHISRYFPMYRQSAPATENSVLDEFHSVASRYLKYVYKGNTDDRAGNATKCPGCGTTVTERKGYSIRHTGTSDGKCECCGKEIYRYFTFSSSKQH